MFNWMIGNGYKLPEYAIIVAHGNLDLFKWYFQKGYPFDVNKQLFSKTVEQWARYWYKPF